ncbi:MAG: glycine cleavage system protein T, partial [Gammaproteobacteria bacterium]|nr:glycine cleavage system protein T [Gammaproteobacteria bacterium]
MLQQTPLIECHRQDGAKLVDFSGWEMPIHYGSQVEEHHQVRNHAGLFDVSHMTLVDVSGPDQAVYLKRLLANDIDRLDEGRALYTAMLNAEGGIIDDLIVYRREKDYRLVVNCATKEKDVAWMRQHAEAFDVSVETPSDYAIIAVQGPESRKVLSAVLSDRDVAALGALKPFCFFEREGALFARTGYTGE